MARRDEYREFDYHAPRAGVRIFGMSVGVVVGVLLLIMLVGVVTFAWAPWKGEREQRMMTEGSGSYRIAAYDSFYDQCGSIQAIEDQIVNMEADKSLPEAFKATNLLALKNQRATLIRQYNADASKADTRANFMASDLPYKIDSTQETTSCAP